MPALSGLSLTLRMLLPPALVLLLAGYFPCNSLTLQVHWPWARISRRSFDVPLQNEERQPLAVRRMSVDVGEMFFPEYWDTREMRKILVGRAPGHETSQESTELGGTNTSFSPPFQIPFALHELSQPDRPLDFRQPHIARALSELLPRDFQCPGGTSACTGIERPNSCCPEGLTCRSIRDSGSGDVGCCADGESCGEEVATCADDQESCPGDQGGGCCVAGYRCAGEGCEAGSTATVIINPTVTSTSSSSTSSTSETSSVSAFTSSSTETVVTSTTSTSTSSSSTSSTSSQRDAPPVAPVRPVSGTASTTETSTGPTTTVTPTFCPVGFYACSAHYLGGCCRIGRDCSSTSCPAPASSLVLNSNGVSIAVAPAEPTRLGEDGCALGWFRCASDGGGGCCPSGYACGESCTATGVNVGGGVTGTAKVAKDNGIARSIILERRYLWASICLFLCKQTFQV